MENAAAPAPTDLSDGMVSKQTDKSAAVFGVGSAASGQLGGDRTGTQTLPVVIHGLTDPITVNGAVTGAVVTGGDRIAQVAAGGVQSGALTQSGLIHVWGSGAGNGISTLGLDDVNSVPVNDVSSAWTGTDHSAGKVRRTYGLSFGLGVAMALKSDGTVWTWGTNTLGQLGANLSDVTAIAYLE